MKIIKSCGCCLSGRGFDANAKVLLQDIQRSAREWFKAAIVVVIECRPSLVCFDFASHFNRVF